jgi:beta-glucanase (GH16 family)
VFAAAPTLRASQWSDEFNGAGAVDGSTWNYDIGNGVGGWGNNELENYTNSTANVNQANGALSITARCCYTSGRINTQGKRTFQMGDHVEARLSGPNGQGFWPAFWALGSDITTVPWPGCGEIDIMEHINSVPNVFGTIHWDFNGHSSYTAAQPGVTFTAYNTYAIDWLALAADPTNPGPMIIWKLNGAEVGRAAVGGINGTEEFAANKPFFVLLNLAIGGSWPGNPDGTTVFPSSMNVDYVRVSPASGSTGPTPTNPPNATPTTGGGTPTPTSAPSGDFTQSVVSAGATTAQARFIPNGYTAGYVILHYTPPGVGQQNVNMAWNASTARWEYTIPNLTAGAVVPYSFTYQKNGTQFDSAQFSYTHTGTTATATATTAVRATPTATTATRATATATSGATATATATATPTTASGGGSCAGVAAFASCTAYANGAKVVYNNTLYHSIATIPNNRDCPPTSPYNPSNDNWWVADGACTGGGGGATPTATSAPGATATATSPAGATATATSSTGTTPTPAPGQAGATHPRLKVNNGCGGQTMWLQWLGSPTGGTLNAANHVAIASGGSMTLNIPDSGLAGLRVWPSYGCDGSGNNCTIGASGGPASAGFTCPAGIGCAPPVDTKFEGTFGCIPPLTGTQCQQNPSAPGSALGAGDWWDSSFVDGFTVPSKVVVHGYCPVGPQPAPVFGPGGPPGGQIDCSGLRLTSCPRSENLSTNGQFSGSPGSPGGTTLANQDLLLRHPNADGTYSATAVGCFSPSAKLTSGQWQAIPKPPFTGTSYQPADPQAQMYTCPTPPITPAQCSAGPAASTNYTKYIHSVCSSYAYAYDDTFGLASCPAAANLQYEVTFYCPQ